MYFIIFVIILINRVNCQIKALDNTILLIGQNPIRFECTSSEPDILPFWIFNKVQYSFPSQNGCGIIRNNNTLFTLEETSSPLTCILVSLTTTLNHAGNYSCVTGTKSMDFISVVTGPPICNNSEILISINNPVELKCSAILSNNGFVYATFNWSSTSITKATTSKPNEIFSNNVATTSINTMLNPEFPSNTIPPYKCSLYLDKFNYRNSSETQLITVNYFDSKRGLTISGNSNNSIRYGTQLVCDFNSNPPGKLEWKYSNGTIVADSLYNIPNQISFSVKQIGNYTCSVDYNDTLVGSYQAFISIDITNVTEAIITYNKDIPLIVGLCVGLGLGIPLLIILLVCCIKKCRSSKSNKEPNHKTQYNNRGFDRHPPEGEMDPYLAETRSKNETTQAMASSDVYAELKMENNPRSRKPVQLVENGTEYATVLKA